MYRKLYFTIRELLCLSVYTFCRESGEEVVHANRQLFLQSVVFCLQSYWSRLSLKLNATHISLIPGR